MTRLRTASVLADLAHALGSSEGAEARLQHALLALRELVPLDRCALVNSAAAAVPRLLFQPPLPGLERGRLAASAESLLASLVEHAPGARAGELEPVPGAPASRLAVPLVALDELAGLLLVERDAGEYGEDDLQLLSVVAALVGAYLASLRQHGEERRVAQELRDAVVRRTQFLGMLSHELRTPLAPIGNALHVLERVAPGGEQARHALAIVSRQFGQLARLVDDLLDATRLVSGRVQVRRARVDLAALVGRVVEDHRSLFVRSGMRLDLGIADRPLWVDGDATRLAQVIGNLLANAAKFASPGGRAEVLLAREAPGVAVVRVRDDGPGIAPDVRSRLFEPFAQGAQTLARTRGGLGLGLALAKGLVDLHGGTIAARGEEEGRGAELVVSLPLLPEQAAAPDLAPGAPGAGAAPRPRA